MLSRMGPAIKHEFGWNNQKFALLIISFRVAYAIGQTISGRFLDTVGLRKGLSLAVGFYSLSSMLAPFASGLRSFCFFRFLLGAGESANWPGATKAVSEWFPRRERALAAALFDTGSSIGGAIAPFLVLPIYFRWGWKPAFVIPGLLGFLWLLAWRRMYFLPQDHPRITP